MVAGCSPISNPLAQSCKVYEFENDYNYIVLTHTNTEYGRIETMLIKGDPFKLSMCFSYTYGDTKCWPRVTVQPEKRNEK